MTLAGFTGLPFSVFLFVCSLVGRWVDGWTSVIGRVGMRVSLANVFETKTNSNMVNSIVEYATREQAQHAIANLSNQSLMGRLVYVREV